MNNRISSYHPASATPTTDASHEVTAAPASVPTTTRAHLGQAADPASAAREPSRVASHTVTQAGPAPVALDPAQQKALDKQLLSAVEEGSVEKAQKLLAAGANVNARNINQQTLLHRAAIKNHEAIARLLLEHGADVNAETQKPQTPLHEAIYKSHEGIACLLLKYGADIDAKDQFHQTSLYLAAHKGHEGIVRLLLEHGADVHPAFTKDGHIIILPAGEIAIQKGHLNIVQCLLEQRSGQIDITLSALDTLCTRVLQAPAALRYSYLANEDTWHMVLMVAWETFLKEHITEEFEELNEQARAEWIQALRGLFAQAVDQEGCKTLRAMHYDRNAAALLRTLNRLLDKILELK